MYPVFLFLEIRSPADFFAGKNGEDGLPPERGLLRSTIIVVHLGLKPPVAPATHGWLSILMLSIFLIDSCAHKVALLSTLSYFAPLNSLPCPLGQSPHCTISAYCLILTMVYYPITPSPHRPNVLLSHCHIF